MSQDRVHHYGVNRDNFEIMGQMFNASVWPITSRMTPQASASLERYLVARARQQFPGRTVALERVDGDAGADVAAAGQDDHAG